MNAKEPQPVPMVPNGEQNGVERGRNPPVKNVIRQPAPPPPSPPKAKSK
jgi:hypothetical protein